LQHDDATIGSEAVDQLLGVFVDQLFLELLEVAAAQLVVNLPELRPENVIEQMIFIGLLAVGVLLALSGSALLFR